MNKLPTLPGKSKVVLVNSYELKRLLIWTTVGALLQICCHLYMKAHPELFEKEPGKIEKVEPETKFRKRRFFVLLTRGGALTIAALPVILEVVEFLANYGAAVSVLGGLAELLYGLRNRNAVIVLTKTMQKATHSYWVEDAKKGVVVNTLEKICSNSCSSNNDLMYVLDILNNPEVPFEEKKRLTAEVLNKYFALAKSSNRKETVVFLAFLLCLIAILCFLFSHNLASYQLISAHLLTALREGKISKAVARLIVRKLRKQGVSIDPTLITELESSG